MSFVVVLVGLPLLVWMRTARGGRYTPVVCLLLVVWIIAVICAMAFAANAELFFVALPLLVWTLTARTIWCGLTVGLLLVGWAIAVMLTVAFTPADLEAQVSCLPVAVAITLIGRTVERRRVSGAERDRNRGWILFATLMSLTTIIVVICSPLLIFIENSSPFLPPANGVLPLPAGLHAQVDVPKEELRDDEVVLIHHTTVTGRHGQPTTEVYSQLQQHLVGRGWDLDDDGEACRPNGWLLDRRWACVRLRVSGHAVDVSLFGFRALPRP